MEKMQLTPDFREFLKLLNAERVEYLLIGGYAVGLYGYVRPTKDIDIWLSLATTNVTAVIRVLERFGFSPGSVKPDHFGGEQSAFRMGVPPNRLELLTRISGVTFDECLARREMMTLDGVEIPVISLTALLANKRASGWARDQADVEQLGLGR